MKIEIQRADYDDKILVRIEIEGFEYTRAKFSPFDRMLIADCETSEKVSDKLLALETIARKIEESQTTAAVEQGETK